MLLEQKVASIQQDRRVHGRLPCPGRRGQGHSGEDGNWQVASGARQVVHGGAAAGQEAGFLKEVGGGISADGQLGENRQPRSLLRGATAHGDDFFQVAGKVADRGIDLSKCDLHNFSLIGRGHWVGWSAQTMTSDH